MLINKGVIDRLHGVIRTGKEASVYEAEGTGVMEEGAAIRPLAVKVLRTTLAQFSNRADYVDGDMRFARSHFRHRKSTAASELWVEKKLFI